MAETTTITGEEIALHEFLDRIDGEAEASKARPSRHWDENLKLSKGEGQWKHSRTPLFLWNLIGNQSQRKIAQITESKPTFSVRSRLGHLMQSAKVLNSTCQSILESQEFYMTIERLAGFGFHMGNGLVETIFDKTLDDGDGEITVNCLDPRHVYLDPGVIEAAKLAQQYTYLRIDHVMTLNEVRRVYPAVGALITADTTYSRYEERSGGFPGGVISATLNLLPRVWRPQAQTKEGPIERTVLKEYWIRDPDTTKWPGGRHILRGPTKGGSVVVIDEANRYWDQKIPVDMIDWRMDLDNPWGQDDVQDLKKLQESMNRLGDAIMRNGLFNSQAWVIADQDALDTESWKKITTEGGLIVKKRPTREFRRDPPPQLPAYMFQMLQAIPGLADVLTGIGDQARTRTPKGGVEAVVDGLQMTSSALARLIARRYEALVQRIGTKLIARIIQFYSTDRMLDYYDPSGDLISYAFERAKLLTRDDGSPIPGDDLRRHFKSYRFLVQPYSSLAMTKMQRAQVGLGLWQASGGRGYPFKRVLELADIGDPETLMQEATQELQRGEVGPPLPPTKR